MAIAIAMPLLASAADKSTGWGDFKLYLDPGHSMNENMGLFNYSEAKKTLRVALAIKQYLLQYTDMQESNIMLCRQDDATNVSLTERSDIANTWDADFYYSIHSDAGGTNNTTLFMYGGWRVNGVVYEKTPYGGKAFGEYLCPNLTGVMRVSTRGNIADRCYYDGSSTHEYQQPYLSVNRRTNMASLLSEAGFHTIAEQQSRNLNDDYKKLEAVAAMQSILKYRGMELPDMAFITGVVTDAESGKKLDGVTVSTDGKSYTTDSYESLFKNYTNDRDLIHNGFYLIEGLTGGNDYEVSFSAPGYEQLTKTVTANTGNQGATADYFTFLDVAMTSNVPPRVVSHSLESTVNVDITKPLIITFSRKMDRASVKAAVSMSPELSPAMMWTDDYTMKVYLSKCQYSTTYTLYIKGDVAKNSLTGQFLDGDANGAEGGDYTLTFTTMDPDTAAPEVVDTYPQRDGESLFTYRPAIRIVYDEPIAWDANTYANCITVADSDGNSYAGKITYSTINDQGVLHFYPATDLPKDKCIEVTVAAGLADASGNATDEMKFRFLTEYRSCLNAETVLPLDGADGFWAPSGSGSTTGITSEGNSVGSSSITCAQNSALSMLLNYSFDQGFTGSSWCIRDHYGKGTDTKHDTIDGVLSFWVYGDGSGNRLSARVYANSTSGGIKYRNPEEKLDFVGWKLVAWDMKNDQYFSFTGSDQLTGVWYLDSFFLRHLPNDGSAWSGKLYFDQLEFNKFSTTDVRRASLSDIDSSVVSVGTDNNGLVDVYNLQGIMVRSQVPSNEATQGLPAGIYIAGHRKVIVKLWAITNR